MGIEQVDEFQHGRLAQVLRKVDAFYTDAERSREPAQIPTLPEHGAHLPLFLLRLLEFFGVDSVLINRVVVMELTNEIHVAAIDRIAVLIDQITDGLLREESF
jgi:hypothetical protein